MPGCSKAKNPRGIEITFTEDDHRYSSIINGKELVYTSVTTMLGNYFPPFDPTGIITERCAKKEGLTVEEIKAKWKQKSVNSCTFGTRVHECCEDIELGRSIRNQPLNDKEKIVFLHAIDIALKFRLKIDILGVEKLIFDERLKIAGTIDLFALSRKTKNYLIIDHKTNEKIEQFNVFKKFCLSPIEHLDDTNYLHYSLLLSLYAYLLKFGGYIPKDATIQLFLNHITESGAKLIEVPNRQTEIKDVMIDWLLKNQS